MYWMVLSAPPTSLACRDEDTVRKWAWPSPSPSHLWPGSYFDGEVGPQGAGDPQDLLIGQLLEVQGGVLQVVEARLLRVQLGHNALQGLTLHVCRGSTAGGRFLSALWGALSDQSRTSFDQAEIKAAAPLHQLTRAENPTRQVLMRFRQRVNKQARPQQQPSLSGDTWLQFGEHQPERMGGETFDEQTVRLGLVLVLILAPGETQHLLSI